MTKKLALLTVVTLICAFFIEIGLRSYGFGRPIVYEYDEVKLWAMAPQQRAFSPSFQVEFRTNSVGYRDDEIPIEKPAGEYRVLALGDSVLFGHGVDSADGTTERVEAGLNRIRKSGSARVINTSVSGYNVHNYRVIAEGESTRLDPDLVLIGLCKNDVIADYDVQILRELARTKLDYRSNLHDRFRNFSGLTHLMDSAMRRVRLLLGIPIFQALAYEGKGKTEEAWDYSVQQLAAIAAYTSERGIPLLVAAFPTRAETVTGQIGTPTERFEQAVENHGQHFLDMQDAFIEARDEVLFMDTIHPTARGHDVAAREILAALEAQNLVPN